MTVRSNGKGVLLLTAWAILVAAVPVLAQRVQGTISGTVNDPSGAVVPKAKTVTNQDTGAKRTASASETGMFTFTNLEPGTYTVSATAPGFKTLDKPNIDLHVAGEK